MPIILSHSGGEPLRTLENQFDHAALFEFSKVINSSLEPSFIYGHVLLTIMGKIMATRGMLLLGSPEAKRRFTVQMVKGFPQEVIRKEVSIARVPRSLVEVESLDRVRHPWAAFFLEHGVKLILPMHIAEKPIGMLGFGERFPSRRLEGIEKTYLRSLANIAATAIEKSRTVAEIQQVNRKLDRKIQELNTLFDLGKEFSAMLDPDKLVRLLVFSLLGQIGVNRYVIALCEGSGMNIAAARLDGPQPPVELLLLLSQLKAPACTENLSLRDQQDPRPALRAAGIAVVVPMQLQGESKGVVLLGDKLSKEAYSEADLEFLSSLVNLATISLENARLFKEAIEKQRMEDELLIAREIQKGLLPATLPEIPGMQLAAINISSKQVGGDYYDAISVDDGMQIIAIGDVSGKGSPAALLMANLQAAIRALVPLRLPLTDLTARVNDLMCDNTGGNKFVTFFWGSIDPQERTFTYVNAGHNYPYLLHSDGSLDRLDKGGMILGVLKATVHYEQATIPLRSGDLLVLFTDGVSEAMSKESQEFGEQRLEEIIRAHADMEPAALITAINHHIQEFSKGVPQSDDITLMILKVR